MYKACIFDLDGTLTDTLDSLVFSVNATLEELGLLPIDRQACRMFVGNGARVLMEKALVAGGERDTSRIEEAMEIYGRIFDVHCTYGVTPYDGICELLAELKARSIRMAVLSNKPDRQTAHVVKAVFGEELFQCVQGQKDGIPRKPDPLAALQMAERMGVSADETVYIGDSEVDIQTGIAAGMKTIGVSWGFRGSSLLLEAGAKHIADSPDEILKLIM